MRTWLHRVHRRLLLALGPGLLLCLHLRLGGGLLVYYLQVEWLKWLNSSNG